MYFPRRTDPLHLVADRLLGLRISLNTPVVATEELAVAPARAAIAVHEEPDGRPNVSVGVRSLKSGAVVLYSYEGDLREDTSLAVGVDAALSFAESMGFLFDDDELDERADDAARARAFGLWFDLMSGPLPGSAAGGVEASADAAAPADGAAAQASRTLELEEVFEAGGVELGTDPAEAAGEELVLDEALELDGASDPGAPAAGAAEEPLPVRPSAEAPPAPFAAVPPAPSAVAPRSTVLTKFRPGPVRPSAAAPPAASSPAAEADVPASPRSRRRAALGRLRLIKRRRGPQPARESWILRLFTSF